MAAIPIVVEQHAAESAILWLRRDLAVREPHYTLATLAKLDGQLAAHLDGLRIAGDAGWDACLEELRWREIGEVFAAAVLALDSGDQHRIESVFKIACSAPDLERGMISALGWTSNTTLPSLLAQWLTSAAPSARRIAVAGYAIRREDPGAQLARLLADDAPRVRARALRAVGELGKDELLPSIRDAMKDMDDSCRFWAAWSAARLSDRSDVVVPTLCEFSAQPGMFQERAVAMAVRAMEVGSAKGWLNQFWLNSGMTRVAAIGIGALGDPELVGVLFQLMERNEIGRVAGDAFSMITGVDLALHDLNSDSPEGFQAGPTEDQADENVGLDPDENLPWPDAAKLSAWWERRRGDYQPGTRYLCGQPLTEEWLVHVLKHGYQRQRAAAALELAIRAPGQPLFNVRAPGRRQQQLLGLK